MPNNSHIVTPPVNDTSMRIEKSAADRRCQERATWGTSEIVVSKPAREPSTSATCGPSMRDLLSYQLTKPVMAEDPPKYRPSERFWPYADLPEQPTDEELAALDPDLQEALFGAPRRPFSLTVVFPHLDVPR